MYIYIYIYIYIFLIYTHICIYYVQWSPQYWHINIVIFIYHANMHTYTQTSIQAFLVSTTNAYPCVCDAADWIGTHGSRLQKTCCTPWVSRSASRLQAGNQRTGFAVRGTPNSGQSHSMCLSTLRLSILGWSNRAMNQWLHGHGHGHRIFI